MTSENGTILQVKDLHVHLKTDHGLVRAISSASFEISAGESYGIVGESGCGKSMMALAIISLLPKRIGEYAGGSIVYQNDHGELIDITALHPNGQKIRSIRGNDIAMVFQEPMTSLTPVYTIGDQIAEAIALHKGVSRSAARTLAIEMLERVHMPAARQRYDDYPHHLSGGMRQRAMIAMALSCSPRILIADEPTTALDVTVQAQILDLLKEIQREFGMALVLISHDLGVVREVTTRLGIFYLGKIVEEGPTEQVLSEPRHPYTRGLLKSIPRIGHRRRLMPIRGSVSPATTVKVGCGFAERCDESMAICTREAPPLIAVGANRSARCWLYDGET